MQVINILTMAESCTIILLKPENTLKTNIVIKNVKKLGTEGISQYNKAQFGHPQPISY